MAIKGVDTKCYILALFVRDDGERFLLGSGHYEFKDTQMHFAANAIQNDIVEVQGNDGFLLAGQVRRPGTQSFDGYVGDGTMSKEETESYRRQFFSFFRKNFFYKVIYVFSDGTAIQRKSGFLVDDPTVEELYQMYPEYHVALNFEDVNYYSYSEDEEGQEQYAKEAMIDTSSMRATGGLVWDNLGVVWEATQWGGEQTASGTEMTIQNEMDVPSRVDDIRLDGDTYQQTYSGKNLISNAFSVNYVPYGDNGFILTKPANRTIQLTFPSLLPAGTYTLSFDVVAKEAPSDVGGSFNAEDNTNLGSFSIASTGNFTKTVTTSVAIHHIYMYIYGSDPDGSTITIDKMQLETGSVATSFEPYVGGIPVPNPDYPQDVQVVTGEQTVDVHGKNLFRMREEAQELNGVVFTPNEDGTFDLVGTATAATVFTVNVPLVGSGIVGGNEYTISSSEEIGPNSIRYYIQNIDDRGNWVKQLAVFDRPGTFTLSETVTEYLQFQIRVGNWVTVNYQNVKTQIEAGSSATTFQPHQSQSYPINIGSIELCKIGDYQDYIYKSGDDWYVHKAVGKSMLGSLSWTAANTIYSNYKKMATSGLSGLYVPPSISSDTIIARCSHFTPRTEQNLNNRIVGLSGRTNGVDIFAYDTDYNTSSSASGFKTWLTDNNVSLYYALATPTDTKITDATLVGQLNALGAMKLFIGENNLIIQGTGTNLPAPLSFKYYTTVAMTGAEWEEGGSGGATVVEVDSITNTYPIWRVKGPAVNPQLSVINTNTTIRYTGTVTSTQTLEIDMFNKTAKLNGVSVIGNVSGDWVSLAPGTNRVIYTAENADAQPSTIEWQEVVG